MKKIITAALLATSFVSGAAFAGAGNTTTATAITIVDGYNSMRAAAATNMNLAEQFALTARANRAGFVKNNFEATLSANVAAGFNDDATNNRFGVVAGSNKGYNVFTGSSVGGSVSQCGPQITKGTPNLGASAVVTATLVLNNANGCGL